MEAAREQIQVFGMDPDHASTQLLVKAPRSGVILDVGAAPGEFSQALSASAPLSTIADITTVWAVGDIYEKDLAAAKSGEAGASHPERVSRTRMVRARERGFSRRSIPRRARCTYASCCRTRMGASSRRCSARSGLVRSSTQGIVVPTTAVVREGNDAYVFVARGNGRFERRRGEAGAIGGRHAGSSFRAERGRDDRFRRGAVPARGGSG